MNIVFDDISRAKAAREDKLEPRIERIEAVLVAADYTDSAAVKSRPGWVWYKRPGGETNLGMALQGSVQPAPDLTVIIQRQLPNGEWYVTGQRTELDANMDTYTGQTYQNQHAQEHEPGGSDPLYVYQRMLVPLRLSPQSLLTVNIAPLKYRYNGSQVSFGGYNYFDLSGSKPASGLARYTLVYLNPTTNALVTVDGSTIVDSAAITPAFPAVPDGVIPSAYVRMSGAQAEIVEADIVDARQIINRWTDYLPLSGGTMTGDLTIQSPGKLVLPGVGANDFENGTGDGASYTTFNAKLNGWWGLGLGDYAGTVFGYYDFRTGTWDVKGGYKVDGVGVPKSGNSLAVYVGPARTYTTIGAALTAIKAYSPLVNVSLSVDAGTYNEFVTVDSGYSTANPGQLNIYGDLRECVGLNYAHNFETNVYGTRNVAVAGYGVCTLANSGTYSIIVSCSFGNPNFTTDGIVAGDSVYLKGTTGAMTTDTVASVSGNTITLANPAPTMGDGAFIVIRPNRRIEYNSPTWSAFAADSSCTLVGFEVLNLNTTAAGFAATVRYNAQLIVGKCLFVSPASGVSVASGGKLLGYACVCLNNYATAEGRGAYATSGLLEANNWFVYNFWEGVLASVAGAASVSHTGCLDCQTGFFATQFGTIYAYLTRVRNSATMGTGYNASSQSYITAFSTSAAMLNVTTPYTPSPSGTVGNINSVVEYS